MADIKWKCGRCGEITTPPDGSHLPIGCNKCGCMTLSKVQDFTSKRADYISWDSYFMGVALLASKRSKDPSTQVGACIVRPDNIVVGIGYNGMPKGCDDDLMPWDRKAESVLNTKYPYVCHAELNAILNAHVTNLKDHTLYVTLHPCNECAKAIIQCGIKKVIYYDNKYADTDGVKAAAIMFREAHVEVNQYHKIDEDLTLPL